MIGKPKVVVNIVIVLKDGHVDCSLITTFTYYGHDDDDDDGGGGA